MPQKNIFTKYPLLAVPHSFVSCGLIRTEDPGVQKLYQKAQGCLDAPSVWEGVFRLASMLTENPIAEPVVGRIVSALEDSEDGSFRGTIGEQIATARAAMALFEYNTDRTILKRIAAWCRYLEIEWDRLFATGRTVFCPADLMEVLVQFYRSSGIKSVLRLCTKLRSAAFDWTTALHTIQQVIPPENTEEDQIAFIERIGAEDLDYDQKQVLLNHAEMLADGIRYSLYAGIFSGNGQDLSAGKTAWTVLQKHYRAICGGTTAGPYLNGAGSNAGIATAALCAWTEAFAAQMLLPDSEWAADELIRIVYNGLAYCLNGDDLPKEQRVNSITGTNEPDGSTALYARATRAAAAMYRHAVTVTESGIRINYPARARYLLMIRKHAVILQSDGDSIRFSCKSETTTTADVFRSRTETAAITLRRGETRMPLGDSGTDTGKAGRYLRIEELRCPQDSIQYDQQDAVAEENTHHRGVCWFVRNRLQVCPCEAEDYAWAAAEKPESENGEIKVKLRHIEGWHLRHDEADDIPVLPSRFDGEKTATLEPYDRTKAKVSMFPRINPLCLK